MGLPMAEGKNQMLRVPCPKYGNYKNDDDGDDTCISTLSTSSNEDSIISNGSSSSSDVADDASSSSTSYSSSSHSNGSDLYDLSELMAQLPIKRGLSKFYQGKSQSFTCLSRVTSIEDLAKKESPYRKKMKSCKSHAGGLDAYKSFTLPKPTISKKASKGSLSSSSSPSKRVSFISNCRPPLVPIEELR